MVDYDAVTVILRLNLDIMLFSNLRNITCKTLCIMELVVLIWQPK